MPVDERPLAAIWRDDIQPYTALRSALDAVMPAHVIYPRVDDRPAGFSRRWIQDLLRAEVGFEGCVFSDDLSMAGARRLGERDLSFAQAAEMALQAGCDIALLCNQSLVDDGRALDQVIDELSQAVLQDRWRPNPRSEQRRLALLPAAVFTLAMLLPTVLTLAMLVATVSISDTGSLRSAATVLIDAILVAAVVTLALLVATVETLAEMPATVVTLAEIPATVFTLAMFG